ncbi:hypothetical protein D9M70_540260 [compost metagenome]
MRSDNDRLIGKVRFGQDDAGEFGFVAGRAAQQINLTIIQCLDGAGPIGIAPNLYLQVQLISQNAQVVRRNALQRALAGGYVEWWVIRIGNPDHQCSFASQPLPIGFRQTGIDVLARRPR